jgi:hypothetical protein
MGRKRGLDDDLVPKNPEPKRPRRDRNPLPDHLRSPPINFKPLPINNHHDRGIPNLPAHLHDQSEPIDLFKLFFTEELIGELVQYTNQNAEQQRAKPPSYIHRRPRRADEPPRESNRPWRPVTVDELYRFLAVQIHMGLHIEACIKDYWKRSPDFGVQHAVADYMSRDRFEQIDRYLYCCPVRSNKDPAFSNTFERIEVLSDHIRQQSQQYWRPGKHLAIDESMTLFMGRAHETTTIECKAASTGYKVWMLGDHGYIIDWRFHSKGTSATDGPYKIQSCWKKDGFSATHAVVLDIALSQGLVTGTQLLPPATHILWLDNLFTTVKLLRRLRLAGVGAAGTVRTLYTPREKREIDTRRSQTSQSQSSQLELPQLSNKLTLAPEYFSKELCDVKAHLNQLPWGTIYYDVTSDGSVGQFAWRDNNVVLFATTIGDLDGRVLRARRRPAASRSGAAQTRLIFGDEWLKELLIPSLIDLYNHHMGGVDNFDQLRSYCTTLRSHCKTWKPLWHLLFDLTLINSYKLSSYKRDNRGDGHKSFLLKLVSQLRSVGTELVPQVISGTTSCHTVTKLPNKRTLSCVVCAANNTKGNYRSPLRSLNINALPRPQTRRSSWACLQCGVAICSPTSRSCFMIHKNNRYRRQFDSLDSFQRQ